MKIILIFIFVTIGLASCNSDPQGTILYLVRHAEKDTTVQTDNPPLTEAGWERAERLEDLMSKYHLKGIYSTNYERNMNTVKGVAEAQNLTVQTYDWYEWHETVNRIKNNENGVFLFCGHGDNLLPIIEHLNGAKPIDHLGHNDYKNLFRVQIEKDTAYVDLIEF